MTANPLAPEWLTVPTDANALEPTVWSTNTTRTARGELEVAGVAASSLAGRYGTPLYVVDEADARGRAR
ncbi:MAG: diaminopimelate decarboxylase, partial [Glaciihabitans sp.]